MLGYCKLILRKMSFSKKLFLKEYRKSLSYLDRDEQNELRRWVRNEGERYLLSDTSVSPDMPVQKNMPATDK